MVNLSTDLDSIRKVIQSANKPRAIIIDPVSAYLGKTDSHKNADVRAVLAPLSQLAAELRVAVIAVSHLRKGEGAALYRTMGSLAFIAAARSAWVVCRDEADQRRRLLLPLKSNIAPDVGGLAFSIVENIDGQPVAAWEPEPVSATAEDFIGHKPRKPGPAAEDRHQAADWLRKQLANGPRPAKDIIDEADQCGFSKRTVQRALRDIGGEREKRGFSEGWLWSLAEDASQCHSEKPGTFGGTWHLRTNAEENRLPEHDPGCRDVEDAKLDNVGMDRLADFEAERQRIIDEGDRSIPF
jgi:hypothetical protein